MSTWRRGSHLTEPVGPMSTRALYSGTVPRPGGSPRQRRPLRSLWAFAYLLGRLSSDLRQSSFFPSRPSTTSERTRVAPRPSNNMASRGHRTFPGLIGKKPAFPKIRTAYRTEAKRKCYHCAIEHSCERRLIFFICLISEWFPYVLPLRHRTLQTQIESCGAGVSRRAHSGGVHGARRRIHDVVPGERRRDCGSAASAWRGEHSGIPGGCTAAAAGQCPRGGFPG